MSKSPMTVARVVELLEASTRSIPGTLTATTELAATPVWDSLSRVEFMSLVEWNSGVELTSEDLDQSGSAEDLAAVIGRRAAE